jgi:hypothetical protein
MRSQKKRSARVEQSASNGIQTNANDDNGMRDRSWAVQSLLHNGGAQRGTADFDHCARVYIRDHLCNTVIYRSVPDRVVLSTSEDYECGQTIVRSNYNTS